MQMNRQLQVFILSATAILFSCAAGAQAQTRVNANEVFRDEVVDFGRDGVTKDGETIIMNDSWKIYGWYNQSWDTEDLSGYSKITAVVSDYSGSASNADIMLFINLFKSADAKSGENVTARVAVNKSGDTTIELDLEKLCPYRSRACYIGLQTWEKCQFKVKEFFLTKGETSATPTIDADKVVVVETTYQSLAGYVSATPHKGVNIVRQRMSDGSVRYTKAAFR